jgi:DNA (cytosine-5)-methyltransferase 3A
MKILSCFDGISCAQVALERANLKVEKYYASEIDKYAIQITQKNYPNTIQLGSIVDLHLNEEIDLMIGGSPCQDLSIAKKNREGLNGSRSVLFWEFVRLLKEIRPKYFILENVASMKKEEKEKMSNALSMVEPIMINAALVSAQSRRRLFWVGKLIENTYITAGISLPVDRKIYLKDILEKEVAKKYLVNAKFTFVDAKTIDKLRPIRLGNINKGGQGERVYSIYGKSVTLSANGGGRGAKTGLYMLNDGKIRRLTPIECERLQSLPDNYTEGISDTQRYKLLGNAFNVEVVAHILRELFL